MPRHKNDRKGQDRALAKRSADRQPHTDKYADKRDDADARLMAGKLAQLAAHFNGEGVRK